MYTDTIIATWGDSASVPTETAAVLGNFGAGALAASDDVRWNRLGR